MAKGVHAHDHGPIRNPGVNVPAGMLKVTLHDVELAAPSLCFCVIKIGPHWGRTATMMASSKATWDWEVRMSKSDPHIIPALCRLLHSQQRETFSEHTPESTSSQALSGAAVVGVDDVLSSSEGSMGDGHL